MSKNVQSVDRVLDLIEAIACIPDGARQKDIQEKLNLPKSTIHRLLSTLIDRGYIEKKSDNKRYGISHNFITIASQHLSSLDIRVVASEHIKALSNKLNVTSHLSIESNSRAVYVEKFQPYSYSCTFSAVGKSIDLYCSALGKALLMGYNQYELNDYVNKIKYVKYTESTITSPSELIKEIEKARVDKITYDKAEHEENVYCIAAPVYDYKNKIIAAISISGDNKEKLFSEKYKQELIECASNISKIFGKI